LILLCCSSCKEKIAYKNIVVTNPLTIDIKTVNNKTFNWESVKQNKATAFIFISPECPLCENYSTTLNNLEKQYNKSGIELIGVIPGKFYKPKQVKEFLNQYNLSIEALMDEAYALCSYFNAKVTPEVFLINQNGDTVYEGKIDNWMYKLGIKRTRITEYYLQDAIDAILNETGIIISKTEAVGCIIE